MGYKDFGSKQMECITIALLEYVCERVARDLFHDVLGNSFPIDTFRNTLPDIFLTFIFYGTHIISYRLKPVRNKYRSCTTWSYSHGHGTSIMPLVGCLRADHHPTTVTRYNEELCAVHLSRPSFVHSSLKRMQQWHVLVHIT